MANSKASALPAADPLDGTEIVYVVQNGTDDVQTTTQAIADLGGGGGLDGLRLLVNGGGLATGGTSLTVFGSINFNATQGTNSAIARTSSSPYWLNYVSAATTNQYAGVAWLAFIGFPTLGTYPGWLLQEIVSFPDGSYGSSTTGARISIGCLPNTINYAADADAGNTSGTGVWFNYSTTRSNGNWWAVSRSASGSVTETDTGIAFSVGDWCLTMWVMPNGSVLNYRLEKTDESAGGSGTISANLPPNTSTAGRFGVVLQTLSAVARNVRISAISSAHIMPETP